MTLRSAMALTALLPVLLAGAQPHSVRAFFVSDGTSLWTARGSRVPVAVRAGDIRIGHTHLVHEGASGSTLTANTSGIARTWSGGLAGDGLIAESLTLRNLYPGVDLLLSFDGNTLKSDYLVGAGADPGQIRLRYEGATEVRLEGSELVVDTFREAAPVAWQETPDGRRLSVAASWRLTEDGVVTFDTGPYDRALPLVIDPWVIAHGTWYGGAGVDKIRAMTVDASGHVYLAGVTESPDFPTPSTLPHGGGTEVFAMKVNPAANTVIWATWLGGLAHDEATSIALHPSGGVVVGGFTSSTNFPAVGGAWPSYRGGSTDGFLARFDSNGALMFSTLVGGSGADRIHGVAVAASGAIWAAGETDSADFPSVNAISGTAGLGMDAFAIRLSAAGAVLSSTKLGGAAADRAYAIAADASGDVYLTGTTESVNFPVHVPFQAASAGAPDAFVTKIAADGSALRYSSYLGGAAREVALPEAGAAIAVDGSGSAYVLGVTSSFSFPRVAALQNSFGGGTTDAFLTKIAPGGTVIAFSTYFGGNGAEEGAGLALTSDGIYAGMSTTSTDLPLVNHFGASSATSWDGYLIKLDSALATRLLASYLAGGGDDTIAAIAAVEKTIYVAGNSSSSALLPSGFPRGLIDGYLAVIEDRPLVVQVTPSIGGAQYTVTGSNCQPGTYTGTQVLQWVAGASCTISVPTPQGTGSTRWVFTGWSDGSVANPRTFAASTSGVVYYPNFNVEHALTRIVASGTGTISASPEFVGSWYAQGASVTLTAAPAAGYRFTQWSGASTSTMSSIALHITGPMTITANFACAYTLASSSANVGAAGGSPVVSLTAGAGCSWAAVSNASWITLNAPSSGTGSAAFTLQAAANSSTVARTGTVVVAGQTFTVLQSGNSALPYTLSGESWTVSGAGCEPGTYTGQRTLNWTAGAQCAVAMNSVVNGGTRQVFVNWSDGTVSNPRTVLASSSASLAAVYRTEHRVTAAAGPGGAVSPADSWHVAGTTVTITAAPLAGHRFVSWSGAASGASNPLLLTVAGPLAVTASFDVNCSYLASPSVVTTDWRGARSTFSLSGPPCAWTASSSVSWLQVFPLSGSSGGQINYTVFPNMSAQPRSGSIRIGNTSFNVSQGANPAETNRRFIQLLYYNFMNRIPADSEVGYWEAHVAAGQSRPVIAEFFLNSTEFAVSGKFVAGLYVGLLNRDAEYGGWLFQRGAMGAGLVDPDTLVANFVGSAEFALRYPNINDQEYVALLYQQVLGRKGSDAEIAGWVSLMSYPGNTRAVIGRSFLNSAEFRIFTGARLTAFLLHAALLARDPEPAELSSAMSRLVAGTPARDIIAEIVNGAEFNDALLK